MSRRPGPPSAARGALDGGAFVLRESGYAHGPPEPPGGSPWPARSRSCTRVASDAASEPARHRPRRDAQGRVLPQGRSGAPDVDARGTDHARRRSSTTSCSTRAAARRCSWRRARGTWVPPSTAPPIAAAPGRKPRSRPPSRRSRRGRRRPRRRPRVLADARSRERAGRLVGRNLAAGALPLRRRRRDVGGRRGLQRAPDEGHVDGRAEGHDARRRQDALDPRRPARQAITCTSACRAEASSRAPTTAPTGGRSTRAA